MAKPPKAATQGNVGIAPTYAQGIGASSVTPQWATVGGGQYGGYSSSPNIAWQGTTSGATYTAASSVLSST